MKLTFLRAGNGARFAKKITKLDDGDYEVDPYPNIFEMDSITHTASALGDMYDLLVDYAAKGWCLLKGNTKKQLINESRRGSHNPMETTYYLVLDLDKLKNITSHEQVIALLGPEFQNVSYIYQPSASAAYRPVTDSFSGHLIFRLAKAAHPGHIKAWLIHLNLTNPILRSQLSLTADARGMKYTLDITTCQNDKLIFISPPECVGFDPLVDTNPVHYFTYVKKTNDAVEIDFSKYSLQKVKENQIEMIAELREVAGLKKTATKTKKVFNTDVIINPAETFVTEVREQGAFVRLNINGGDSWAYWHPKNNWEIIHSFKDDTSYLASAFVPEYYKECQLRAESQHEVFKPEEGESSTRYIAFLDRQTDLYYRGTYEPRAQKLELFATGARDKVNNFFASHGLPVPEHLPEWDYRFDFSDTRIVDFDEGFLNRYVTPQLVIKTILEDKQAPQDIPPTIKQVIHHALGSDDESFWRFINWFACIFQLREPPRTAWLTHGNTGTGKGKMFHLILAVLLGEEYVGMKRLDDYLNRFNRFHEDRVLELVDEADAEALSNNSSALASSLKNLITEPRTEYEAKGQPKRTVKNWCSYIFTSNTPTPVHIEYNDRRFNVAPRQEKKLPQIDNLEKKIEAELPDFVRYLLDYKVDVRMARTPLVNEAYLALQRSGMTSLHEITAALRDGDFDYFVERIPAEMPRDFNEQQDLRDYLDTLEGVIRNNGKARITTDDTEKLFKFLDPATPHRNKFLSMTRKQGLINKSIRIKGNVYKGYAIDFELNDLQKAAFRLKCETVLAKKEELRSV